MRRQLRVLLLASLLTTAPLAATGRAQILGGGISSYGSSTTRTGIPLTGSPGANRTSHTYAGPGYLSPYYAAPGNYGTAWGSASYGSTRNTSNFSSPYSAGYGYNGIEPYGYQSNRYGVGLWRPGYTVPGYSYRSSYYWTFAPAPIRPPTNMPFPPMGAYAPGFGPPTYAGW